MIEYVPVNNSVSVFYNMKDLKESFLQFHFSEKVKNKISEMKFCFKSHKISGKV